MGNAHCRRTAWLVALSLGGTILVAQAPDSKVSSAPGGVPVSATPATKPPAPATNAGPLSRVFRVRVVDGRNGLPVDHAHLRLWYDEQGESAFPLTTNAQGIALMPAPVGTPVRVLLAPEDKVDCRKTQTDQNPGVPPEGYNLLSVAEQGVSSTNHCGPIGVKAAPGELVLFVRPLRWYEGLNRP